MVYIQGENQQTTGAMVKIFTMLLLIGHLEYRMNKILGIIKHSCVRGLNSLELMIYMLLLLLVALVALELVATRCLPEEHREIHAWGKDIMGAEVEYTNQLSSSRSPQINRYARIAGSILT